MKLVFTIITMLAVASLPVIAEDIAAEGAEKKAKKEKKVKAPKEKKVKAPKEKVAKKKKEKAPLEEFVLTGKLSKIEKANKKDPEKKTVSYALIVEGVEKPIKVPSPKKAKEGATAIDLSAMADAQVKLTVQGNKTEKKGKVQYRIKKIINAQKV